MRAHSLRECGRHQNVRNVARAFDMAIVASLQFGTLPARCTRFPGKRLEEWSRRVSFRNAGNERGWDVSLSIGWKAKRLLKTAQAKITQPRAHEITRFARLQSPEIKLPLAGR